jgi:hypothetical protein
MQEERPNRTRVIAIVLIFVAVFGGWYVLSRPGTRRAAEQTADVFVPAPEEIERRRGYVEDARLLTDAINERQLQAMDHLE